MSWGLEESLLWKSINKMNTINNINKIKIINKKHIKIKKSFTSYEKGVRNKRGVKCNYRQNHSKKIQRVLREKTNKQIQASRDSNKKIHRGEKIMVNERKTESIVRKHFDRDSFLRKEKVIIEEQQSENPRIKKLLKNASKKGEGTGYPEFIISYKDEPNLIIVIECKGDIRKHESVNKDKYSEYAVDGSLLYSSYLSKEFDVISIAVSGQTKKELKVSHFLQTKNSALAKDFVGEQLLSLENYLDSYGTSEIKFNQDYSDLMIYSKELNTTLHKLKVKESYRSLLISGILLALKREHFRVSYEKYNEPRELTNYLVNTIYSEIKKGLQQNKVEGLKRAYSFIQDHEAFSKDVHNLKDIIRDIDKNINQFIITHKYRDVLGQFYIEFLRYANSDKGLGIVLTPPHITELFTDIASVNKDSIIFDNCCGTGGFLISAMKRMIENSKENDEKIKGIKQKQLVGIEYQNDIFALACSNMFIHGDGKSGIFKGDCFDKKLIKNIKSKYKPNIGFLNPPYKSDKKNDTEEFEYVLNNLDMIEPNGLCIAIVPMSGVTAQSGKIYELKKRLLKNNTLEAVFSMPNDLFVNSKVGTITAVIVLRAHQPHPKYKETFFGYWKEDGFVKNRVLGRCDYFDKWSEIKKGWLYNFKNKKTTPYSLTKLVDAKKEWCIEAYMQPSYEILNKESFVKVLKEYGGYLFLNNLSEEVSKNFLLKKSTPKLNIRGWKDFKIDDLFEVYSGGDKPKETDLKHQEGILVNSIENLTTNNGIKEKILFNGEKKFKNFISMVSIGAGGHAFYQSELGALFTRAKALVPKDFTKLNVYTGLFLVAVLRLEKMRYSYGRVLDKDRLKETYIKLPTNDKKKPDWEFMENYIKSLPYSKSLEN